MEVQDAVPADAQATSGSHQRHRWLLIAFAVLAFVGILLPGIYNYLLAGDSRQLVVSLVQGSTDADRERLKSECGALPGVSVVVDKGAREAQYRFPVRFRLTGSTEAQEIALSVCLDRFAGLIRSQGLERDR